MISSCVEWLEDLGYRFRKRTNQYILSEGEDRTKVKFFHERKVSVKFDSPLLKGGRSILGVYEFENPISIDDLKGVFADLEDQKAERMTEPKRKRRGGPVKRSAWHVFLSCTPRSEIGVSELSDYYGIWKETGEIPDGLASWRDDILEALDEEVGTYKVDGAEDGMGVEARAEVDSGTVGAPEPPIMEEEGGWSGVVETASVEERVDVSDGGSGVIDFKAYGAPSDESGGVGDVDISDEDLEEIREYSVSVEDIDTGSESEVDGDIPVATPVDSAGLEDSSVGLEDSKGDVGPYESDVGDSVGLEDSKGDVGPYEVDSSGEPELAGPDKCGCSSPAVRPIAPGWFNSTDLLDDGERAFASPDGRSWTSVIPEEGAEAYFSAGDGSDGDSVGLEDSKGDVGPYEVDSSGEPELASPDEGLTERLLPHTEKLVKAERSGDDEEFARAEERINEIAGDEVIPAGLTDEELEDPEKLAKVISCVSQVKADQPAGCEPDYPRSEGCYNPWAVCRESVYSSPGGDGDFEEALEDMEDALEDVGDALEDMVEDAGEDIGAGNMRYELYYDEHSDPENPGWVLRLTDEDDSDIRDEWTLEVTDEDAVVEAKNEATEIIGSPVEWVREDDPEVISYVGRTGEKYDAIGAGVKDMADSVVDEATASAERSEEKVEEVLDEMAESAGEAGGFVEEKLRDTGDMFGAGGEESSDMPAWALGGALTFGPIVYALLYRLWKKED